MDHAKSLADILKQASDVIKGVRSNTASDKPMPGTEKIGSKTEKLSTGKDPGVDYMPKSGDEQEFVAKHSVERFDNPAGNPVDFATKGVKYSLDTPQNSRMGRNQEQSKAAYEETEVDEEKLPVKYTSSGRSVFDASPKLKPKTSTELANARYGTDRYTPKKKPVKEENLDEMSKDDFLVGHHGREAAALRDKIRGSRKPNTATEYWAKQAKWHEDEIERLSGKKLNAETIVAGEVIESMFPVKHPGALHRALGVPQGEKIPASKLSAAAKKGGKLAKEVQYAKNMQKHNNEFTPEGELVDEAEKCNHTPAGTTCSVHGKTMCPGAPKPGQKQLDNAKKPLNNETLAKVRSVIAEKVRVPVRVPSYAKKPYKWSERRKPGDKPITPAKSRVAEALDTYFDEAKKKKPVLSAVPPNTVPVQSVDAGFGIAG